jgi:UDP-N-acetylmuramate dehydrogenase
LIEQCGWKGKKIDAIGVHERQALVLVNYGGGKGENIWQLAMDIQQSVKEKFNITLHPEVNVI